MLLRILDRLEEIIITSLMAAATILIFVFVVPRFGTGVPFLYPYLIAIHISWAQELCIYMFIWMAKFGAAYGVRTGIHVGVDILVNRVPARSRKQVILFSLLCGALFTAMIGYLAIPLGSGLMCFRFLQVSWFYYWTGELPHHNEAHVEGIEVSSPALHPAAVDPAEDTGRSTSPLGLILIMAPILILMVCLGEKAGIIVMPHALRAATIFALLIALMLTGIPVSIALGLTVLTFLFTLTTVPIEAVSMKLFTGIESFEIMAIPFFILAGNFLTHGGVARRVIDFAPSLIGHWHGGLGLAGIVACSMFALVCGSSVATVAAVGAIVLPEMVRNGYPMRLGAGIITVAGSLGLPIPPSIPKIIYAISTGTSIGA